MTIATAKDIFLREWEPEDEMELIRIAQQEHIQKWLSDWDHPKEWIGQWIVNVRNQYVINDPLKEFVSYAIVLSETREVVGQINTGGDDFDGEKPAIAYFMDEAHLNRGLTTQAAQVFTEYLFDRYNYDDMSALVEVANIGSNKVVEKAGYTRLGTVEKQLDGMAAPEEFVHWCKKKTQ